jgi:hypothetical protein
MAIARQDHVDGTLEVDIGLTRPTNELADFER